MSLNNAMDNLRKIFDKYAGKEGDKNSLNKAELGDLLRTEFKCQDSSKEETEKFFNMLDNDRDGCINFHEYISFIATLAEIQRESK